MKPISIKLLPLVFSLAFVTGCGGSGGEDSASDGSIATDGIANADGTDSTNGMADNDGTAGVDSADNSDDTPTDGEGEGNTIVSNDTNNTVCGGITSEITYEIFHVAGSYGVYVPSYAPGNIGWDGSNYCDLTSSQGVEDITMLVPYVQAAPLIDGEFEFGGEWGAAAMASWSNEKSDVNLIRNLLSGSEFGYVDGSRAADWQMMHDGTYLYINAVIRNDWGSETGNAQIYLDSDDPRDDDSIDIFIDGDNSKGIAYDGANDFHSTLALLDRTWTPEPGAQSATGLDLSFRTSEDEDNDWSRFKYEMKIKLSTAGIVVGVPFGFDIQLNEDDTGGARDARFAWHESAGSSIADSSPSVFATLVLTGCADNNNCNLVQNLYGR